MESYLDNRTREAKESSDSDAFSLPEMNASAEGEGSIEQGTGTDAMATGSDPTPRFDPGSIQDVPIALESVPEEKRPKVQLVMEDDRVSRVIVTCSCGECIELECNY